MKLINYVLIITMALGSLLDRNRLDTAYQYAEDIKSGKIPACVYIKQAVDRFYDDIKNGHNRGIVFDEDAAQARLTAFDFMNIKKKYEVPGPRGTTKLQTRREAFILEPWQAWIKANKYGFYKDGFRRFSTTVTVVSRKNGKTTLEAADVLVGLLFDGEMESEVYCVATKKDQAMILFNETRRIISNSPLIKQYFPKNDGIVKDRIYESSSESIFAALAYGPNTLDGLNPHTVKCDEVHEWDNSEVIDVMESGMGDRVNPSLDIISTAGFNKDKFLYQYLQSTKGILDGTVSKEAGDSIFLAWYTQDSEEEIKNPKMWIKSSPNLGVSVQQKYLEAQVREMSFIPTKRVGVLTKNFNIFTDAAETWISPEQWNALYKHPNTIAEKTIKTVWGGLDFASAADMYAISWFYEFTDGTYYLSHRFYAPEQTFGNRYNTAENSQKYAEWEAAGHLHTTPGKVIDSTFVEDYILDTWQAFGEPKAFIGYDPYRGTEIVARLNQVLGTEYIYDERAAKMVEKSILQPIKQTVVQLTDATQKFEEIINSGTLTHDGNPVMAWHVANAITTYDNNGNVKPDRKNPKKKIDGVYSSLDAIKAFLIFTQTPDANAEDFKIR